MPARYEGKSKLKEKTKMKNEQLKKLRQRYDYREAYKKVNGALWYAPWQLDDWDKGTDCIEDIPVILESSGLSEIEKKVLVEDLANDLPDMISLWMNELDVGNYYLKQARFSKIFDIKVNGRDYKGLLKEAFGCYSNVLKNPKYYGVSSKTVREKIAKIKKEFGLNERRQRNGKSKK